MVVRMWVRNWRHLKAQQEKSFSGEGLWWFQSPVWGGVRGVALGKVVGMLLLGSTSLLSSTHISAITLLTQSWGGEERKDSWFIDPRAKAASGSLAKEGRWLCQVR